MNLLEVTLNLFRSLIGEILFICGVPGCLSGDLEPFRRFLK